MAPWIARAELHPCSFTTSMGLSHVGIYGIRRPITHLFSNPYFTTHHPKPIPSNVRCQSGRANQLDNLELLLGDVTSLLSFSTYKQIAAIVNNPGFPGWLEPLHFNPLRFEEFLSFALTLIGTWVCCAWISGAYRSDAAASLPTALSRTCTTWIASMPVAAAQLVLLTAAEDRALVGTEGWATVLPLAASGPGEPFVTAAGVLGLMATWRAFYAAYLDQSKFLSIDGARMDRETDAQHFSDALKAASGLAVVGCLLLHFLSGVIGTS